MEFSSISFLIFLTISLIVYWNVPKKFQWLVLLAASGYFYFSWQIAYGSIIFISTLATYLIGLQINKPNSKKKLLLFAGIGINLGILFIFKYFNFFSFTLAELSSIKLPLLKILLPIGISFYTFQLMGYLFDVYHKKIEPEKNIGQFLLFVLFFPKLIAGPIEKSQHFLPQLAKKYDWKSDQMKSGLKLFAFGLFKKIVIADNLALVVNRVFGSLSEYKGLSLIIIIFLYSWQILADFSGYTDMARGIARLFGYNLMENFNTPYFSTSIRDFWRRWHISLSTWLREYLYFPLGGSRASFLRVCLNYLIVFVVCGIWHGAAWNFVLWGLLHGLFIVMERIADYFIKGRITFPKVISYVYTYVLVCISWVLFRAANLEDALYIYKNSLIGARNFISPSYIWATLLRLFLTNRLEMFITFLVLFSIIAIEFISTKYPIGKIVRKQSVVVRLAIYTAVVTCIILLHNVGVTEFIYVQF